jgi:A/G-specific adenine glycosylase
LEPEITSGEIAAFVAEAWRQGTLHARDGLPWRYVDDAYQVCVSEVMLQQTQVSRVLGYWPRFVRAFPTVDALASADVSDVLELWQGLGYNRRALALKRMADICSVRYGGKLPDTYEELLGLPGVGSCTAAGIVAFARNRPAVYIETNVRAVFIRHFFPDAEKVTDKQLAPLVERTCSADDPRGWYYALLDWGAYLKSTGENAARRSAGYTRQSAFEGSRRQKRAFILREVLGQPGVRTDAVKAALDESETASGRAEVPSDLFESVLQDLVAEGFFRREGDTLTAVRTQ